MKTSAYLIDRDGVLRTAEGGKSIPGATKWMDRLKSSGLPFLIATNHTTSSPEDGAKELRGIGFPIRNHHMHTPLTILSDEFKIKPPGKIYARGAKELLRYLEFQGLKLVNDSNANTVLLGFDRKMDYAALTTAIETILHHGARFIALHKNRLYKNADGTFEPGLGAWVAAIEHATRTQAEIIGKPSKTYFDTALRRLGCNPKETVMISDDPVGDLAGAKQCGIHTVFVLTGKYDDPAILDTIEESIRPDIVLKSITEIDI